MKIDIDYLDRTYKTCLSTGAIKEKAADLELIRSMKLVADINFPCVQ
jgi:hypothetical protein